MFNIAVINIKDLIRYLVGIVIAVMLLIWLARYFSVLKKENKVSEEIGIKNKFEFIIQHRYLEYIEKSIPGMENGSSNIISQIKENQEIEKKEDILKKFLQVELSDLNSNINDALKNNQEDVPEQEIIQETIEEQASTDVGTEVVTPNPIATTPTDTYGNVQIRNQTGYVLNEEILKPDIEISNSNIIIFHTHTCESYTPTEQNQYEPSGTFRTTDLSHSVAKVGDELENHLNNYGYHVLHDKTYHDYPAYTGSYSRSLKTIESLKQNNNADIIIDLHRDAIGSNSEYAPTVRIGEDFAAQLMFVIGTDGGGLWHPNWGQNLKFAVKVQQKAEELYPGLFKPIILRNSRYNQHVTKAATIIEVGATGNTLEQSETSMKYLAKILNEVIN